MTEPFKCSECGVEDVETEGDLCDDCFYDSDEEDDDFDGDEEQEFEADDP